MDRSTRRELIDRVLDEELPRHTEALAMLGVNGWRLTMSNDEAYELIISVATGELDDAAAIAARLERGSAR